MLEPLGASAYGVTIAVRLVLQAAATLLLELIFQNPLTPVDLPPARLVVRGSTGAPPAHPRKQQRMEQ